MSSIALKIEVPIACFRQSRAREYAETYPVPPPSTIYGMLLSIVGETDRYKHCGVKLAIALLSNPAKSRILRTFRRFKKKDIHDPSNARPDYQEILTDVQCAVWINRGNERNTLTLPQRLEIALNRPDEIDRFGGLSLGESRDLVNSVSVLQEHNVTLRWLEQNDDGLLTLPYWVDHVGSKGTRWLRYHLLESSNQGQPPELAWTFINSA